MRPRNCCKGTGVAVGVAEAGGAGGSVGAGVGVMVGVGVGVMSGTTAAMRPWHTVRSGTGRLHARVY